MTNQKGVILTITLIFVIVLTIIAGVSIVLMTNHARITEYQIKRIRAYYTAEAALTHVLQGIRDNSITLNAGAGGVLPGVVSLNGYTANVTYGMPGSGYMNTRTLNVTVNY